MKINADFWFDFVAAMTIDKKNDTKNEMSKSEPSKRMQSECKANVSVKRKRSDQTHALFVTTKLQEFWPVTNFERIRFAAHRFVRELITMRER